MNESREILKFEDFIQSELFTFLIGREKTRFVVHSKAISATSPVFDKLINGGLKESQDRSAELEDVDPETFIRFLEYAYRHDYTTPTRTQEAVTEVERDDPKQNEVARWTDVTAREVFGNQPDTGWSNSKSAPSDYGAVAYMEDYTKQNTNQIGARTAFSKREYRRPAHDIDDRSSHHSHSDPDANTSPSQDCAPIFLAHARLYTFADMRMARRLKDLVLHKLHKTLVSFEVRPERVGDVVELVRYAYEHGEDRSEDGRIDAMRDMVVSFVVSEMKVLGEFVEFRDLIEAGGEFAGDFWNIVSQ